ncbi:VOC family protein [Leptospira barantonii]|uniref:Glyoxalase-like domain protein n=1 Tax=Leptospira barantonii TaxID=2023184 RepID=A0ABX4NSH4_9LEPT|nr:VOC family protein [Leptospira barantonii]PJZ59234.1 glyoxalase-like domain protein [Leptospira barantonii]
MKKTFSIIGVLFVSLFMWWFFSASKSDYRTLKNSDFFFETVIFNSPNPERLSGFYQNVFNAKKTNSDPVWNPQGSNDSTITLRTPDYRDQGPLLTILKNLKPNQKIHVANDLGYAHICFETDDVPGLIQKITEHGGKIVSNFEDLKKVPAVYATDPDGNVFEVHLPFPSPITPRTIYRTLNSLIRTNFKLSPPATDRIRFLHVNINSKDWSKTVSYYKNAFGTATTGFERDYKGEFIERLTGVMGAEVKGRHLELPGYSEGGPTFEVFTYNRFSSENTSGLSDQGRIATGFRVLNLKKAIETLVRDGGILLSEVENRSATIQDGDGNLILLAQ